MRGCQIETHLVAEDAEGSRPRSVIFPNAALEHEAQEVKVLLHLFRVRYTGIVVRFRAGAAVRHRKRVCARRRIEPSGLG